MEVIETEISDVKLIIPSVFHDSRGYFLETYHFDRYTSKGISQTFLQDNLSISKYGVIRGLHLQNPNPQGKLVYVIQGEVFDVVVDLRLHSPTFGKWVGVFLSEQNKHQLWIPKGFAHGFCVTSERAIFAYKCTDIYHQKSEISLRWNDSALGIKWPIDCPILSEKDAQAPLLADIDHSRFLRYESE